MKRIIGSQFWGFIKMEFLGNGLESALYKVLPGFKVMMPKIVSKLHNSHVLETTPVKQKQKKILEEYRCSTGQRLSES